MGAWGRGARGQSRAGCRRARVASRRRRAERALRWRYEDVRARGVLLGPAVPRREPGGAAPALLRAGGRRLARLPRPRRLRGARAVRGARRRHRARAARAAPPGPLARRARRGAPAPAAARRRGVLGPLRGAAPEPQELYRVRGEEGPRRRGSRPAAEADRQVDPEDPRGLQARIQ